MSFDNLLVAGNIQIHPELKKSIINQLSLMNSKEAVDYLMEYLKD